MGKNKLSRFSEIGTYQHVFEPDIQHVFTNDYFLKNNWHHTYFKNNGPIIVELGCGKGEYTVELAKRHPEKNFIGIDIKGARIWKGAKQVNEENIRNVAFVRTRIELIQSFFGKDEVQEIWITFPDPQEKNHRRKKRLTSARFLNMYKTLLHPDGVVHLKTDNSLLYQYTLDLLMHNHAEHIVATDDLYNSEYERLTFGIQTFYEKTYLAEGKNIHYLQFKINGDGLFEEPG